MPEKCGDCGWWVSNPIQPDRTFGYCTQNSEGLLMDDSPVRRRNETCRKWSDIDSTMPVYQSVMLTQTAPEGCQTCSAKADVYKSPLCLKSTFVSVDSNHLHYRKCSLMTPRMCRYGRVIDAMKRYTRGLTNGT